MHECISDSKAICQNCFCLCWCYCFRLCLILRSIGHQTFQRYIWLSDDWDFLCVPMWLKEQCICGNIWFLFAFGSHFSSGNFQSGLWLRIKPVLIVCASCWTVCQAKVKLQPCWVTSSEKAICNPRLLLRWKLSLWVSPITSHDWHRFGSMKYVCTVHTTLFFIRIGQCRSFFDLVLTRRPVKED